MLYTIVEHYPWWAIPLILILLELIYYFKIRNQKKAIVVSCVLIFVLVLLIGVFFYFNGFQTARPALYRLEQEMFNK